MTEEFEFNSVTVALMDAAHDLTTHAAEVHDKVEMTVGPAVFQSVTWYSSSPSENPKGETFFVFTGADGRTFKSQLPSLDRLATMLWELPLNSPWCK